MFMYHEREFNIHELQMYIVFKNFKTRLKIIGLSI